MKEKHSIEVEYALKKDYIRKLESKLLGTSNGNSNVLIDINQQLKDQIAKQKGNKSD